MLVLKKIKSFINHRLFEEYRLSYEALALYRITFAVVYLLILGVPSFTWLSQVAEYFYAPQLFNIARLLASRIPNLGILLLIDLTILFTLVTVLFGWRTKIMSWLLASTLLVGYALRFSLGKIDHTIVLIAIPAIMSFSGWEQRFSLDSRRLNARLAPSPDGYAPFILALVLGFSMFTAGVPKLLGGWLLPDQSGVFHHFFSRYYFNDRKALLAPLLEEGVPFFVWKAMDYTAVLFEVLFLPAVLNKRIFQVFCVVAVAFHVINLLVLNITFNNNLLAYLLFIRWAAVVYRLKSSYFLERLPQFFTYQNFAIVLLITVVQYYWCVYVPDTALGFEKGSSWFEALTKLLSVQLGYLGSMVLLVLSLIVIGWQWSLSSPSHTKIL